MKDQIIAKVLAAMPDATVSVRTDDEVHFELDVTYEGFKCLTRVKQHRLVYDALGDMFDTGLHALAIHTQIPNEGEQMDISQQIEKLIDSQAVVLFMKGDKDQPMCGFSARVVGVLKHMDVDFLTINVLLDDAIREGIKAYTQWPTIPQLYINGEFVGGCDIVCQMHESGELQSLLASN